MVILTLLDSQRQVTLKRWCFEHESVIRIGRALDNHVILSDSLVSRYHLELRRTDLSESLTIERSQPVCWQMTNHSTNGTFLNGHLLSESRLPENAVIQLAQGGPTLRVQILLSPDLKRANSSPQLPDLPKVPLAPNSVYQRELSHPTCKHLGNLPNNLFCIHCGQPVKVEKIIRQYQVLRVLGRGGMGTTYLVWHPTWVEKSISIAMQQGRLLVLKEMNADIARIPKAQELFEREACTLQALSHPGVPKFYDFFIESGKKHLVMELLHGQDLEKWVSQRGPVTPQQAIAWMIQTCEVLNYLHTRSIPIIHRDIKPGNLLVKNLSHRVVVLDFGAVKSAGMPPGTCIGAEGYSAPEQTQGRPVPQSDLFSIGPSLVFLLTGSNPQRFYKKITQGYRFLPDPISAIAPNLHSVIKRTTEIRPRDRYQTAQDLAQALAGCLHS